LALGVLTVCKWEIAAQNPVAAEGNPTLHVHFYNLANVPEGTLNRSLQETSRILAAAGVRVVWEPLDADSPEGHTVDMTGARFAASGRLDDRGFLVVRTVRGFPAISNPGMLGFALPSTRSGVHATVFYDRIETVAISGLVRIDRVLGNAMAHEIGHVLLGSNQHSQIGIMKAVWSRADYQHMAFGLLEFQPDEAAVLRREVSRRAALGRPR
jgi:hypothetical protein